MKTVFSSLKILAVCAIAFVTGRDLFGGTQMTRYEKQSHHSAMRNYIIDLAKYKDTPDTLKLFISDHEKRNPSAVFEAKEFLRTGNSASRIRTTSGFRMDADDSSKEVATIMRDARAALGIPAFVETTADRPDPASVETSTFAKAPADGLADRPAPASAPTPAAVALAKGGAAGVPASTAQSWVVPALGIAGAAALAAGAAAGRAAGLLGGGAAPKAAAVATPPSAPLLITDRPAPAPVTPPARVVDEVSVPAQVISFEENKKRFIGEGRVALNKAEIRKEELIRIPAVPADAAPVTPPADAPKPIDAQAQRKAEPGLGSWWFPPKPLPADPSIARELPKEAMASAVLQIVNDEPVGRNTIVEEEEVKRMVSVKDFQINSHLISFLQKVLSAAELTEQNINIENVNSLLQTLDKQYLGQNQWIMINLVLKYFISIKDSLKELLKEAVTDVSEYSDELFQDFQKTLMTKLGEFYTKTNNFVAIVKHVVGSLSLVDPNSEIGIALAPAFVGLKFESLVLPNKNWLVGVDSGEVWKKVLEQVENAEKYFVGRVAKLNQITNILDQDKFKATGVVREVIFQVNPLMGNYANLEQQVKKLLDLIAGNSVKPESYTERLLSTDGQLYTIEQLKGYAQAQERWEHVFNLTKNDIETKFFNKEHLKYLLEQLRFAIFLSTKRLKEKLLRSQAVILADILQNYKADGLPLDDYFIEQAKNLKGLCDDLIKTEFKKGTVFAGQKGLIDYATKSGWFTIYPKSESKKRLAYREAIKKDIQSIGKNIEDAIEKALNRRAERDARRERKSIDQETTNKLQATPDKIEDASTPGQENVAIVFAMLRANPWLADAFLESLGQLHREKPRKSGPRRLLTDAIELDILNREDAEKRR